MKKSFHLLLALALFACVPVVSGCSGDASVDSSMDDDAYGDQLEEMEGEGDDDGEGEGEGDE